MLNIQCLYLKKMVFLLFDKIYSERIKVQLSENVYLKNLQKLCTILCHLKNRSKAVAPSEFNFGGCRNKNISILPKSNYILSFIQLEEQKNALLGQLNEQKKCQLPKTNTTHSGLSKIFLGVPKPLDNIVHCSNPSEALLVPT